MLRKTVFKHRQAHFIQATVVGKSDKINILRKQYDAFLEEDKRRKERNENILQKLDKMRVCDKIVPYRTKIQYMTNSCSTQPFNRYINVSEPTKECRIIQPPAPVHTFGIPIIKTIDKTLLKEISENYILIPKLRKTEHASLLEQTENETSNTDDFNWKSKYDILNKLKQSGKNEVYSEESVLNNGIVDLNKNQKQTNDLIFEENEEPQKDSIVYRQVDSNIQNVTETPSNAISDNTDRTLNTKAVPPNFEIEIPERHLENVAFSQEPLISDEQNVGMKNDVTYNSFYNNHSLDESRNAEKIQASYTPHDGSNEDNFAGNFDQNLEPEKFQETYDPTQYYEEKAHNEANYVIENCYDETEYSKTKSVNDVVNDNHNTESAQVDQAKIIYNSANNGHIEDDQENYVNTFDILTNQPNNEIQFNKNDSGVLSNKHKLQENYVVPEEQTENNVEERAENIAYTEGIAVENQDYTGKAMNIAHENIDPAQEEYQQQTLLVENTVNPDHESAIEDFEKEQSNMFYSDPNQQAQYGEGDVYDQVQERQDENYLHDEQYNAHYDTVLTDQVYSVEVNDDEQVLDKYDQSYGQQYTPEYLGEESQQPIQYDDQQQPYNSQHMYENQPPQDQQLYVNQHYESQQYEVQQQDEPQPFVDEPQYKKQQNKYEYEQMQNVDPQDALKNINENIDTEHNIERQLDKEDGLYAGETQRG